MSLSCSDVTYSFGAVQVLHGISLAAQPGEITCIMGRNGVGKTTLMRTLMGTYQASSGTIDLTGTDITKRPAHQRAKSGIALVPQGREILPRLSVEDNLRIGLRAAAKKVRKIPSFVYETFPVLGEMKHRMGGDLSGGQQQQLAIARALVGEPQVLMLDEPTEGIQPNVIQLIGDVLQRLADEQKMTIILVEQYLDFIREIGDTFFILSRGQVVATGQARELDDSTIATYLSV